MNPPLRILWWLVDHAAYILGAWAGAGMIVGIAIGLTVRRADRQATPEVWGCGACGHLYDTASAAAQHMLRAHPEACPWDPELGSVAR